MSNRSCGRNVNNVSNDMKKRIQLSRVFITLLFLILITLKLSIAATYYVAKTGNDSAPGTEISPFLSIQKGADIAVAGDTVIVEDGIYDQIVTVRSSGVNPSARILFKAQNRLGAQCTGFRLQGDYITIDGFILEASTVNNYGIYTDNRHHITVTHCLVKECPGGGINITGGAAHALISGNTLDHNGQWGIHIAGSYATVENNEVLRTVQHHPKIEFTGYHGEDADGLRIFGDHHLIRGNYIHDIGNTDDPGNHQATPEYPNDFPHVDCLQSWDRSAHGGRPVIKYSTIENNHCSLTRASGKGLMISAVDGTCTDLVIKNNIFEYRDIGISMNIGSFRNVSVMNNLFKANLNDSSWGAALHFQDVENYNIQNNLMVDGHAEARKIIGGSGILDYNLIWYSDGSLPNGTPDGSANEKWAIDPEFYSYTGLHGGNYRLRAGSQAIDAGSPLPEVSKDREGNSRPLGLGYDIGPYEYDSNKIVHILHYMAGDHGKILGAAQQVVQNNGNGTIVSVLPYSGYSFLRWSDGRTDNPRTDVSVQKSSTVRALYRKSFPWLMFKQTPRKNNK